MFQSVDPTAAAAVRPRPSDSPANHTSETSACSSQSQCSAVQPGSALLSALFHLSRSPVGVVQVVVSCRWRRYHVPTDCVCVQRPSVCVKAYESLLLLACLQGELQSLQLQLALLLARRLQELHLLLPPECLEEAQLQSWPATPWRYGSAEHKVTGHRSKVSAGQCSGVLCCCQFSVLSRRRRTSLRVGSSRSHDPVLLLVRLPGSPDDRST